MKRFVLFCLLLVGCSNMESKHSEPQVDVVPTEEIKFDQPEPVYKTCELSRIDKVSGGCTIYTFDCEDDSNEYRVACDYQPMGYVTDPPRPVEPVWESMTRQE